MMVSRDSRIIAFGWGYVETGEEFADQKYRTDEGRKIVAEIVGRDKKVF